MNRWCLCSILFCFLTIMLKKGLYVINCDIVALSFCTARVVLVFFSLRGKMFLLDIDA